MALNLLKKIQQGLRFQKLGHRLTLYFVAIGLILTMITIAALLFRQYEKGKAEVYHEAERTIAAVNQQLARSLWNVDQDSTKILL